MTSQLGFPVSAISDKRQTYTPSIDSPLDEPGFAQSSERTTIRLTPRYLLQSPQRWPVAEGQTSPISSTPSNQTGTYESFWREHSGTSAHAPSHQAPIAPMSIPSLAPPVDIHPGNTKRSGPPPTQPPRLESKDLYISTNHPSTPPSRPSTKTRTPSQQAAVEKDAVETLLFMSSPGNSGYHPPHPFGPSSGGAGTPLRSHVLSEERTPRQRIRGAAPIPIPIPMAMPVSEPQSRGKGLSEKEIDRMLDEMGEGSSGSSSSDEEDLYCRDMG